MNWKVFILCFVMYQVGWWMNELMRYIRKKIERRKGMTLNEWEQINIEVLTSREMGEWLSRRENRLLEQIRAEIEQITDTMGVSYNQYVSKIEVLQIIDKHRAESEE